MRQFRSVLAKGKVGFSVVILVLGVATTSMADLIIATEGNVTPGTPVTWTTGVDDPTANTQRVLTGIPGYTDPYAMAASNTYPWMNIGTSWQSLIPAGQTIVSATLSFNESTQEAGSPTSYYSVFAVPGTDLGVNEVLAAGNVAGYYASHTGYGLVTGPQIGGPVSFDITNLMVAWKSGAALPTNVGQMMILCTYPSSDTTSYTGFGNAWAGTGANITITTAVPEPSTLVLLATGLFGLLAYAWRKRR